MIDNWVGHHHSHRDSPVSRLPTGLKLSAALVIIVSAIASGLYVYYRLGRLDLVAVLKTRE